MYTPADRLNVLLQRSRARLKSSEAWRRPPATAEHPQVFYGDNALQRGFGGAVKVRDLQPRFPHQPAHPNLYYTISSVLNPCSDLVALAARRAGIKLVLNQNGVAYPAWFGSGWKLLNRPMRRILERADYVVYQSAFCREAADRFLGRPSAASSVLYNPVDTSFFAPAESAPVDGPLLLVAGSHEQFYRVEIALDVLAQVRQVHPDARLEVAGRFTWDTEAAARREVLDAARKRGVADAVSLSGPYAQDQAPALFQRAHLLLHAKYNDPCPRLVVEAMACGVPVVFSATGGVPELIGEEGGIGVPGPTNWEQNHPPAADAMAEAALQVLDAHEEFSVRARARAVRKFDVSPWVDAHGRIFREVLGLPLEEREDPHA